jgi:hypothetical protein
MERLGYLVKESVLVFVIFIFFVVGILNETPVETFSLGTVPCDTSRAIHSCHNIWRNIN